MKEHFIKLGQKWKHLLREKSFRISFLAGILFLLAAHLINYQASLYTETVGVLSVGYLILDYIPTVDLSLIYIFGIYIVEFTVAVYPLFFKPELAPFTAKTIALFYIVRAFFIILTHLGAPAGYFDLPQLGDQPGISKYFFLTDLFFSGHTGFPFLAALLFWKNFGLRVFMILMSAVQAATVLFMHVHYSIDVFSAYFITYTIY